MDAQKRRVIVLGARGVFGSLLVNEFAPHFDVVEVTRGMVLDARGAFAVACAAGPFQQLDRGIVRACVDAGAHWLDIADDEPWFFDLVDDRELDALARERGVVVMPGLSTLPAVSGALVRRLAARDRDSGCAAVSAAGPAASRAAAPGKWGGGAPPPPRAPAPPPTTGRDHPVHR